MIGRPPDEDNVEDDPRLAEYRHVGDPDWLRGHGLFVAEGRLVVERLLSASRFAVRSILLTPAAARALERALETTAAHVLVVEPPILNGITGFNFHRGCIALARRPDDVEPAALRHDGCLLGLEGVGNPDNVGGLFRTAAAFGVSGVVLDPASGDPFYRKALRTSMGAVLRTPFARTGDWIATLCGLRDRGVRVLALTPDPAAVPLDEVSARLPPDRPRILLFGSEGSGLSDATLEAADDRVRIPIAGGVDSLNVTVAAGIALSRLAVRW